MDLAARIVKLEAQLADLTARTTQSRARLDDRTARFDALRSRQSREARNRIRVRALTARRERARPSLARNERVVSPMAQAIAAAAARRGPAAQMRVELLDAYVRRVARQHIRRYDDLVRVAATIVTEIRGKVRKNLTTEERIMGLQGRAHLAEQYHLSGKISRRLTGADGHRLEYQHISFTTLRSLVDGHLTDAVLAARTLPYVTDAWVEAPIHVNKVAVNPPTQLTRPLGRAPVSLRTGNDSCSVADVAVVPGECVIDVLFSALSHNVDGSVHKIGRGRGSKPITREHIAAALCAQHPDKHPAVAMRDGFSVMDAAAASRVLGASYIRVFDQRALNAPKHKSAPIYEEHFKTKEKACTRCLGGVSMVVHGDHAYQLTGKTGKAGQKEVRPGVRWMDMAKCIVADRAHDLLAIDGVDVVFVTTVGAVHNRFVAELSRGNYCPLVRVDRKTREVLSIYADGQLLVEAPDVERCRRVVADLSKSTRRSAIEYTGQALHSLMIDVMEIRFGIRRSLMSPAVLHMFRSPMTHLYSPIGWTHQIDPADPRVHYFDVCRAYTAALKRVNIPIIELADEFARYDPDVCIVDHGIYMVAAPTIQASGACLMDGPSLYPGTVVRRALADGVIRLSDIRQSLVTRDVTPAHKCVGLVEYIDMVCGGPRAAKLTLNALNGALKNSSTVTDGDIVYTRSWDEAESILVEADKSVYDATFHIIPIGAAARHESVQEVMADRDAAAIRAASAADDKIFCVTTAAYSRRYDNHLWQHYLVIRTAALMLYEHCKRIGGTVVGYNTDAVAIMDPVDTSSAKLKGVDTINDGDIRHDEAFRWCPMAVRDPPLPRAWDTNASDDPMCGGVREMPPRSAMAAVRDGESMALVQRAGYGKTTLMGKIVRELLDAGKRVLGMAPTHTAKDNLTRAVGDARFAARTVASVLGIRGVDDDNSEAPRPCQWTAGVDVVVVDELFAVPAFMLAKIVSLRDRHGTQCIVAGDPKQLPPVGERKLDKYGSVVRELCASNYALLNTNYRLASADPEARILAEQQELAAAGKPIDAALFQRWGTSEVDAALCFTNHVRRTFNEVTSIRHFKKHTEPAMHRDTAWYITAGLPVIGTFNTKHYSNAQRFIVSRVAGDEVVLDPPLDRVEEGGSAVTVSVPTLMKHFQPAYAMTVHKTQGHTLSNNYIIFEYDHDNLPDGWLYTALTRAQRMSQIFLGDVGPLETIATLLRGQ